MRQGITRVALITALLAVLLFGAPLAYVMNRLLLGDEQAELERLALRAAVNVPAGAATSRDPIELPRTEASVRLGVYGAGGRRVVGTGPRRADRVTLDALAGNVSDRGSAQELIVAVPVARNENVTAVVRASSPRAAVAASSRGAWAAMVGLALLACAAATALAIVAARRLARPIERLEEVAEQLGGGNFSVRAASSGVAEIDRAADALNKTAERLGDVVSRERAFAAHASHQLRTPLTGLRLTLDNALTTPGADLALAAREAIRTADELSRTVDDVLALARADSGPALPLDLVALLADTERRWHGLLAAAGRPLRIRHEAPPRARASAPAVRQILDVLVDNAYRHGRGAVVVTARDASEAAAIDVQDDGSTTGRELLPDGAPADGPPGGASRLGLSLARRLAEAEGGRLLHARTEGRTRLTLLLPAAHDPDQGPQRYAAVSRPS